MPRRLVVLHAVALALGIALCFVPLFDLLGYESSAAAGFVLGLLALIGTVHRIRSGEIVFPHRASISGSQALAFSRLLLEHQSLQVLPLAALLLNMVRVQNCDPLAGVAFWLAIVPIAIGMGQFLAWVASALVGRRGWLWLVAPSLVLIDLLWFGLGLALRPPITGHSLLFGYFAGSLYDEAIHLPSSLLWYRAANVAVVVFVLALLEPAPSDRGGRIARLWIQALSFLAILGLWASAEKHGVGVDQETVEEALGGRIETEHFVIYFSHPDMPEPEDVRRMAEDHEYRYWELQRFFDVDVNAWRGRKIESFVYPSPKRQHDLMGAQDTFVARPWTHQMHIRWDEFGDSSVAHEMAHLFSAAFGHGPFQIATRNGIPADMGLIEGIAHAADWPPSELPADVASAAMRKLDIAPKLEKIFGPFGFWTQPSAKAYTLMGSFVRFLVERHGIDKMKQVYAEGDFEGVYGVPVKDLLDEWRTMVDAIALDESTLERARARYDKKSIFEKVCARTLAELDRKADALQGSGDFEKAIEVREKILSFQPKKASHKVRIAKLLKELERYEEALAVVDEVLATKLKAVEEAEALELEGDLLYLLDRTDEARTDYATCRDRPLGDGDLRRLDLKERALFADDEVVRGLATRYLFATDDRTGLLYMALRWAQEEPGDPLARYLVGLQLWNNHDEADAIPWLVGPPGTLPTEALDDQRLLLLGYCLYRVDALDDADAIFAVLTTPEHGPRVRLLALEWRDRVTWKSEESSRTATNE